MINKYGSLVILHLGIDCKSAYQCYFLFFSRSSFLLQLLNFDKNGLLGVPRCP